MGKLSLRGAREGRVGRGAGPGAGKLSLWGRGPRLLCCRSKIIGPGRRRGRASDREVLTPGAAREGGRARRVLENCDRMREDCRGTC